MKEEKFIPMGTKVNESAAKVWDAICQARQTDTYHLLQNFIYTMIRAAADPHALNPDIQKILTMLDLDADWQNAINLAAPSCEGLKVAQMVLILEQEGKRDFAAVMINKSAVPGEKPELRMTENVDDILERVCEVTMKGIYRRLRLLGGMMECNNLSDVLLTLIEKQGNEELDAENQREMQGSDRFTDYGKEYAYGKRTKQTKRKNIETLPTFDFLPSEQLALSNNAAEYEAALKAEGKPVPQKPKDIMDEDWTECDHDENLDKLNNLDFQPHGGTW